MRTPPTGYELLLFDLDGTLLGPDGAIRPATLQALQTVMAGGVQVGFATGRPPRGVRPFVEALAPNGPVILLNGGMLWDAAAALPIATVSMPRPDALAALEIAAELGIHANLYVGDDLFIAEPSPTSRESEEKDGVPHQAVGDLAAFLRSETRQPLKVLLIHEEPEAFEGFERRFRATTRAGCTLVRSERTYLEVLPPGVTKGAALADVEAAYGIAPSRVVAFGDSLNDLELLVAAGLGIAMANAHPLLRERADLVIGPHGSDAIADFLRQRTHIASGVLSVLAETGS